MEAYAAVITAIAALLGALAWPVVFVTFFIIFREPLGATFRALSRLLDRLKKLKFGDTEMDLGEALDRQASRFLSEAVANPQDISAQQIRAAAKLEVKANHLDVQTLKDQIESLCTEYETIRKVMPSGPDRTQAMTEVLVKMRMIGPAVSSFVEEFKGSTAAGKRLAAVAIMQIEPDKADFAWLTERFRVDQPFIFYHAAIALFNIHRTGSSERRRQAQTAAQESLEIIGKFEGPQDRNTLHVLKSMVPDQSPPP